MLSRRKGLRAGPAPFDPWALDRTMTWHFVHVLPNLMLPPKDKARPPHGWPDGIDLGLNELAIVPGTDDRVLEARARTPAVGQILNSFRNQYACSADCDRRRREGEMVWRRSSRRVSKCDRTVCASEKPCSSGAGSRRTVTDVVRHI